MHTFQFNLKIYAPNGIYIVNFSKSIVFFLLMITLLKYQNVCCSIWHFSGYYEHHRGLCAIFLIKKRCSDRQLKRNGFMFDLKSVFLLPPTFPGQQRLIEQSQRSVTDINLGNFKHCYFHSISFKAT